MKKQIVLLLSGLFLITSCSKDSDSEGGSSSKKIKSFSVTQIGEKLKFNYSSDFDFEKYEVSRVMATLNNGYGSGQTVVNTDDSSFETTIKEPTYEVGKEYRFGIRGIYDIDKTSEWFGAEYLEIEDYCSSPYDLHIISGLDIFKWETRYDDTSPSSFEIQYGESGFELGTGKIVTSNNKSYEIPDFQSGKTYDCYVRGFCNSQVGWTDWVGPESIIID